MATKKISKKKPVAKAKKPVKKSAKPAKKASKPVAKPKKKPTKPVKKAKVVKAKPANKKKPVAKSKPKSNTKAKPKVKPKSKPKAVAKTNTKKKSVVKKAAKKIVKPIKKVVAKKPAKKVVPKKTTAKKVVKKATPKAVVKTKPSKSLKPNKVVKPEKTVKPVKESSVKPVKDSPIKPVKTSPTPVVKEKTPKKIAMQVEKSKSKTGRKPKKQQGDEDEPKMDELDPLIEEMISLKKKGKGPKIPKVVSPIKLIPTVKIEAVEKEHIIPQNFRSGGKEKFEMEFFIKSSPRILFNFISSPSGLSEWFSDDVNIKNGIYTFLWEDSQETAKLLATREFELMRLKWTVTEDDDTYFEMRIKIDELTGDVALIVTDFAKKEELDEAQRLWDAQIHDLCKAIGS